MELLNGLNGKFLLRTKHNAAPGKPRKLAAVNVTGQERFSPQ